MSPSCPKKILTRYANLQHAQSVSKGIWVLTVGMNPAHALVLHLPLSPSTHTLQFHPRALELLEDIAVFAEKHPAANRPNYASGALSGESRKFLQELQKMPEPDFLTLEKKQELEKVCNVLRGAKGSLHATARKMENAVGIKLTNPYFGPGSMSMNACHFIPESIDYLTSAITVSLG